MSRRILFAFAGIFLSFNGYTQVNDQGKFSAQVFADYFYNIVRDTGFADFHNTAVDGSQDFQGFILRRAAINYDKDISEKFSARFRLEADSKSNSSNGKIGVFVKDAYLKWKNIFEGSDLILGIQPTTSFEVAEKYWGYRSLEKTIQDLRGFVQSRDFGVALRGKISETANINYAVMIGNNNGNNPETDKYKRYYFAVDLKPGENFIVALTADFKSAHSIDDPEKSGNTLAHNSMLGSVFIGYNQVQMFCIGLETAMQLNQNSNQYYDEGNILVDDVKALGISVFGTYHFSETFAGLLRYDYFDAYLDEKPLASSDSRNYLIAGIDYKADKNVSIIPNVIFESYESDTIQGVSFKPSVTGRLTLYYNF